MLRSLLPAVLLLGLAVALCEADPFSRDRAAFVPRFQHHAASSSSPTPQLLSSVLALRGGATIADEVDEVSDDDEEDEEDEEEIDSREEEEKVVLDAKMAASALKSASKTKAKQASQHLKSAKEAVNTKLSQTEPSAVKTATKKPKKQSLAKMLRMPYIIRAALNPLTLFAMTKAYWASLFNLDYLEKKQAPAQELRSALEEKAKRSGGGAPSKKGGRRKMKRGQAKTLSDLPQLST